MDLGILQRSPQMAPLLVKLYDSQKLDGLAKDDRPAARAELASCVVELLELDVTPRESELVVDVLIGLMRQAALDVRKAMADRLAVRDDVPLRLVLQMANDEIAVAQPVLSLSKVLSDLDLIYIVKSKGSEYWQAIAQRSVMSDQMINVLVDTSEIETVKTLVENTEITLTDYCVDVAADMACEHDVLAKPLLQREEVGPEIARRLYAHVGEALKAYIGEEYGVNIGDSVAGLVDEVIDELHESAEGENPNIVPTAAMLKDADRQKEKGLLTITLVLGTLRRGQIQSFIAQFSRLSGMSVEVIIDILLQPSGQGLAVVCRAMQIQKPDFISMYLLTNRIRYDGKMVDLKDMTKAIDYFMRIDPAVAKGIVENSLEEALKD